MNFNLSSPRGERIKTILVVDDSHSVRLQVCEALTAAGLAVVEAQDGLQGSERIQTDPSIALVVCDVHMPRMGGLELLASVRLLPTRADLQFLMLTSEVDPALMRRAREHGARGWLIKPFQGHQLVMAVQKLLSL